MDNDCSDLDAVRYNSHYNWLLENMHTYGFILRYPDDKENKTKIAPESWHLRYVGVDLATYLYKNNLALDEYYGAQAIIGLPFLIYQMMCCILKITYKGLNYEYR